MSLFSRKTSKRSAVPLSPSDNGNGFDPLPLHQEDPSLGISSYSRSSQDGTPTRNRKDSGKSSASNPSPSKAKVLSRKSADRGFHRPDTYADAPVMARSATQGAPSSMPQVPNFAPPEFPGAHSFRSNVRDNGTGMARSFSIASLYPSPSQGGKILTGLSGSMSSPPGQTLASFGQGPALDSNGLQSAANSILSVPKSASLPNVRKSQKQPMTFNLLAIGARNTGKSSLLRMFLQSMESTGDLDALQQSPSLSRRRMSSANDDNALTPAKIDAFAHVSVTTGRPARTKVTKTVSGDVVTTAGDRMTLTCIDTPGLDVPVKSQTWGDSVNAERQVSQIVAYLEDRFEETLKAENQVYRHSHRTQDAHIHLVLYFIHPESIAPLSQRKGRPISNHSATERGHGYKKSFSQSTPQFTVPSQQGHADENGPEQDETDQEDEEESMSDIDIKCLRKLAKRANILPIIARADELTSTRLAQIKTIIKRDLAQAGLNFGVFASNEVATTPSDEDYNEASGVRGRAKSPAQQSQQNGREEEDDGNDSPVDSQYYAEDSAPVKVVRMRSTSRHLGARRKSKSTILSTASSGRLDDYDDAVEAGESTPSFEAFLPFAVVCPENTSVPSGAGGKRGGPRFKRTFKWGTVDCENPEHTDFVAMREALLGGHVKLLRESTRLHKYEVYRTQRLLQTFVKKHSDQP